MAEEEQGPTWRYLALGAITLVFSITGYLIGDFISTVRDKLHRIQETIDSRASLPPRLEAVERAETDHENRLRALEQEWWRDRKGH